MSISSFRAASVVVADPESAAEAGGAASGNRRIFGDAGGTAGAEVPQTRPGIPPGKTGDGVGVLCHDDLVSSLPTPPPLIGRDAELRALTEAAGLGATARSGVVLLSGDAGIGKSRLIAALTARGADAGWRVAVGHCLDLGGSPLPYLPFTEIVGRLAATRPELMSRLLDRWAAGRPVGAAQAGHGSEPGARRDLDTEPVDRATFFESLHAVLA